MAWRKIPLLSHQEQFLTSQGPMKTWFDRARAMEADPRVLQASNYPMQPWLDVAEGGWATIVVTDGDRALAEQLADELADLAWSLRDAFQVREARLGRRGGAHGATPSRRGVVVLSDTGDTVFGGSAGDSNLILEADAAPAASRARSLVPMIAPDAVAQLDRGRGGRDASRCRSAATPRRRSSRRSKSPAPCARIGGGIISARPTTTSASSTWAGRSSSRSGR